MIDCIHYQHMMDEYNRQLRVTRSNKVNGLPGKRLYPFGMHFIILYVILILYIMAISMAMCVDIEAKCINDRIPMIMQNLGSPTRNDILTVTARLYFAIITCFVYKRLKILPDLYTRLKILPDLYGKMCPHNIYSSSPWHVSMHFEVERFSLRECVL